MPSIDSWPSVQDTTSFLSAPQTFVSVCLVMHLFCVPPDGSIHPGDFPPMSSSTNFATLESAIMSTCAHHFSHNNGWMAYVVMEYIDLLQVLAETLALKTVHVVCWMCSMPALHNIILGPKGNGCACCKRTKRALSTPTVDTMDREKEGGKDSVRVHPRLGGYWTSGCLWSSNGSTKGHSRGTHPG